MGEEILFFCVFIYPRSYQSPCQSYTEVEQIFCHLLPSFDFCWSFVFLRAISIRGNSFEPLPFFHLLPLSHFIMSMEVSLCLFASMGVAYKQNVQVTVYCASLQLKEIRSNCMAIYVMICVTLIFLCISTHPVEIVEKSIWKDH